jgi:4-diphosphocytidyl-2-C-methyl-D-erythritol kinase
VSSIRELARAKVNLTLRVLGRRADGFHALESLVVFAETHDVVELAPGEGLSLHIGGAFADGLGPDNLILRAAEAAEAVNPHLRLGQFHLTKHLPVAAGLGGGSADAAAALRLIARANPGALSDEALVSIATPLGSDVAVCLASQPALIFGRGEIVRTVRGFPACGIVLANPRVALPTASVYGALDAPRLAQDSAGATEPPDFHGDFAALIDYVLPRGNDLEAAAARLAPSINEVLAALTGLPGVRVARLSGSGPTCFALFASEEQARHVAAVLTDKHPDWWIAATALTSPRRGEVGRKAAG